MIEVMVDFVSFKWSPICKCNLLSSCIEIIVASVSAECSHFVVLKIEGIITIGLVVLEKCKCKFDQKYFV